MSNLNSPEKQENDNILPGLRATADLLATESQLVQAYPYAFIGNTWRRFVRNTEFDESGVVNTLGYLGLQINADQVALTQDMIDQEFWFNEQVRESRSNFARTRQKIAIVAPSSREEEDLKDPNWYLGSWCVFDLEYAERRISFYPTHELDLNMSQDWLPSQEDPQTCEVSAHATVSGELSLHETAVSALPTALASFQQVDNGDFSSRSPLFISANLLQMIAPELFPNLDLDAVRSRLPQLIYRDPAIENLYIRRNIAAYLNNGARVDAHVCHSASDYIPINAGEYVCLDPDSLTAAEIKGSVVFTLLDHPSFLLTGDDYSASDSVSVPLSGGGGGDPDRDGLYQVRSPQKHSHGIGKIDDLLIPYKTIKR